MIDTRSPEEFAKGHIAHSINIGLDGSFAVWAGTIIRDVTRSIAIICTPGTEQEVLVRLSRVGFDHTSAYLFGGIEAWVKEGKPLETIESISVDEFFKRSADSDAVILDVRKASEFESQHLVNAINIPLDYLSESNFKMDKSKRYYVHCAGGYRSMIFISILRAEGITNLIDVKGGFSAIKALGKFEITEYAEPVSLL
jgi:rhodanese-related sulfurtransferase